jgi:hypothetical protein
VRFGTAALALLELWTRELVWTEGELAVIRTFFSFLFLYSAAYSTAVVNTPLFRAAGREFFSPYKFNWQEI